MIHLDTNVVIDLIRGPAPALRKRYGECRVAATPLAVSAIVVFELRFGALNSNRAEQNMQVLDAFLGDAISVLAFDTVAAAEAAAIRAELRRAGRAIGAYNALIAGHARSAGALLVTGNMREFQRVSGLSLTDWLA